MKKSNWIWMAHAGHFICGHKCQFKLNTYVGKYIVSTVGEMPNILDKTENSFEEIGVGRKYETMVFKAKKSGYKCCPYVQCSGNNFDFRGYNTSSEAYIGHLKLCNKWSKK